MNQILFVVFVSLNFFVLLAFFYGLARIEASRTRTLFLSFMGLNVVWLNLLYFVQLVPFAYAEIVSHAIYGVGVINIFSGGLFLLSFSGKLDAEMRSIRFWIFATIVLANLCLLPWISPGVVENSIGMRQPLRGPGTLFFGLSWLLWFSYTVAILIQEYRVETDRLYRFQMRHLFKISLLSFSFIFCGISVAGFFDLKIPGTYIGMLGSIFLFVGMVQLLSEGKLLFIKKSLKRFFQHEIFSASENLQTFESLLYILTRGLATDKLLQPLQFTGPGNRAIVFTLARGNFKQRRLSARDFFNADQFRGMQDTIDSVQRENIRLGNATELAQRLFTESEKTFLELRSLQNKQVNRIIDSHEGQSRELMELAGTMNQLDAHGELSTQLARLTRFSGKTEMFNQWAQEKMKAMRELADNLEQLSESQIKAELVAIVNQDRLPFLYMYSGENRERLEYLHKNLHSLDEKELLEYSVLLKKIASQATGMTEPRVHRLIEQLGATDR